MKRVLPVLLGFAVSLAAQLPLPHPLFEGDAVHDIHLTFESPNWYEQLRANFEGLDDPVYMEATFVWGDIRMEKVGVRFKGNSSYRTYPGAKKSFKIKTNEFVKGRRINGVDTLNLNNAFKDPSYLREKIYYELAREAGLKAPRVNYAALYVNAEYWGLYFLTEDIDGEFLENHVGAKENGNMYKGDPRGTLEWRGADPSAYKRDYEKDNNEKEDDWSDLIEFVDALNRTPREMMKEKLDGLLDVESAAALLAVDILTANLDSYVGSGHNYYLYHRKSDGKFMFFPWDPNEAFGNFTMGLSINELQRLPLEWLPRSQPPPPGQPAPPPNAVMPRPLAQRIYEIPEYRMVYLQKVKSLLEGAAEPERLLERMRFLHDMLRPYVERETRSMFTVAQFERSLSENQRTGGPGQPGQPPTPAFDIPGLDPFLRARADSVTRQLVNLLPPE
jgi:hypothetical protein